jgi:hypothetical protein
MCKKWFWFSFAVLLVCSWPTFAADLAREFQGVRSLGMGGAQRGVPTSNDCVVLNPAGIVASRRYSIDVNYGYAGGTDTHFFALSAVDSKTSLVGGALAYTYQYRAQNKLSLHRIYISSAYPLAPWLALGVTGRNVRGDQVNEAGEKLDIEAYSSDVALNLSFSQYFSFAVNYHHLIKTGDDSVTPPRLGLGLGFVSELVTLGADLDVDLRPAHKGELSGGIGGEVILGGAFILRLGYRLVAQTGDEQELEFGDHEHSLSGGAGWGGQGGTVEVSYEQSLSRDDYWVLVSAIKLFI